MIFEGEVFCFLRSMYYIETRKAHPSTPRACDAKSFDLFQVLSAVLKTTDTLSTSSRSDQHKIMLIPGGAN